MDGGPSEPHEIMYELLAYTKPEDEGGLKRMKRAKRRRAVARRNWDGWMDGLGIC